MPIAQGTVLKCVVTGELPGEVVFQNVFYYQVRGINPVDEAATLAVIATAMNTIYNTMSAQIIVGASLDVVTVHEWDYNALELWHTGTYIGEALLADTFAAVGNMLPHATAAVITGKTGDVNTRSRKSFAGFDEATQDSSSLNAPSLTAVVAAGVEWLLTRTILAADYLQPVVPALAGLIADLLIALVGDILGSQRQRKPGIGV